MPGVERRQHFSHLRSTALAKDNSIWAHPKRFADQLGQADKAPPFSVGSPGLKPHTVLVRRDDL
jgi:hypothetical protein